MQQCGGAASVHALQQHEDEKVREIANRIVQLYLADEQRVGSA